MYFLKLLCGRTPFGLSNCIQRTPEKIPAVILKVYFKTLGRFDGKVLHGRIPLGSAFAD